MEFRRVGVVELGGREKMWRAVVVGSKPRPAMTPPVTA